MKKYIRKTTPKVKNGKVQKKNNWSLTPNYYNTKQKYPVIDKEKPGPGYKHLIKIKELYDFIDLLPKWDEISKGLDAVVLAAGWSGTMGWHDNGVVGICAWEKEIYWDDCDYEFYKEHKTIFKKLDIPCIRKDDVYLVEFEESSAKAFQLIHVFIHELGHHHDRMTTKSKLESARGEGFAEKYAKEYEDAVIDLYRRKFKH